MSSIPALPTRGSDVKVLITKVNLHPLCVLVEFWGTFSLHKAIDYEFLVNEIQSHGALFKPLEGNPGDQCLVDIDGTWYRARIVSRDGSIYRVFLIDRGMTYTANSSKLAWGKKEHFQLPPEVELCILANVFPVSSENRWSPLALEFLKSFSKRLVHAHVQDVLMSDRIFLLNIPCISKQMYEMGFAKMSPVTFQGFLHTSLKSISGAKMLTEAQKVCLGSGEQLQKQELLMYPELLGGTVETVIVTEVMNPQQIFCQLKVFSHNLKKLTEKVTQSCQEKVCSCIITPEMVGYPCAARGKDGTWYRSVIQQVFPANKVVEVLNVDYGTKQFVQVENVKPLAAELTRMPVVTYICSLHGIPVKRAGWTASEIDFLKSLLLHKTAIAKVEYQSISDQVYYVTLYDDDNNNINRLFCCRENYFPNYEKTLEDYALPSLAHAHQHPAKTEGKILPSQEILKEKKEIPVENLTLNSSHLAVVQQISNPLEFWIKTKNYQKDLEELLDSMYHLYRDSPSMHMVENPALGLYCAAQAQDGEFYRAAVTEVGETQIKVFFMDNGNTEVVEIGKIRSLLPEFRKMPQLSLKCSLAGVRPKGGRWSQSALEYFIKAVADKAINVHVKEKYTDNYVVQLTNPKKQDNQDIATQMCSNGFAEMTESPGEPTVPDVMTLPQVPKDRGNSSMPMFHLPNNEKSVCTFKEQMFPIGSILDVNVSCVESPNDFWCQLVQNARPLSLLMDDMQAYYTSSEFEPNEGAACVARHPDNRMWYRALVIRKRKTPQVDVMFVDYGQTETVSIFDLRKINPEFLTLHGQAFRCSLLNLISPTSAINEWNCKANGTFQRFVQSAASSSIILKCTIYAVMYSEQMVLHNIVDLETPFESICTSMANLVTNTPPKKATGPTFRLDTYYYSTHNIKTGTEEPVTVVFVSSVGEFYCHLNKNADVMKDLTMRVNTLCQQLEKVKFPAVFGTLCFARYTDGQWYRAQIKATKPKLLVHFVDYGNTLQVDKSDLLPVPKEANDIMSVPVQAVACALSDVPTNVSCKVNKWFEESVTEGHFCALVVAREVDGKLLVELYDGNTQINSEIKKIFQIEKQEEQVVCQVWKPPGIPSTHAPKMERIYSNQAVDHKDYKQAPKNTFSTPKLPSQTKTDGTSTDENRKSVMKSAGQKLRSSLRELYKPPYQRQPIQALTNDGSGNASAMLKPKNVSLSSETTHFVSESLKENTWDTLPKLTHLPSKCITPGTEVDVYVSHCDSLLSFFVQLVYEEDELFSLVEKLNNPHPKANGIKDVHPGDLVKAQFAVDLSWYRAVVKERFENATALIEFIDFGNTAVAPIAKMERLPTSLLCFPVYSIHCMLRDAAVLGEQKVLDPNVVSAFKEDIGSCGDKVLKCQFIKPVGSVWEVSLKDSGMDIECKASIEGQDDVTKRQDDSEKAACSPGYPNNKEVLEGQQLEVYITTINEDQTFWCLSADSEQLCTITVGILECGDGAYQHINPDVLYIGMPCVALFAEDQLWYRAEVVDKNDCELSVLFVDYGNKSQVSIKDVRAVPPALREIPAQAFLCELEGFCTSSGSWRDGAAEELSTLTADKLLQLTITRVMRTEGKLKYAVKVECEGQVINEGMNVCWICTGTPPDSVESTMAQQTDSITTKQDHPDYAVVQVANKASWTVSQTEEHSAEELNSIPIEHDVLQLVSTPKQSECSEDSNNIQKDSSEGMMMLPVAMTPPEAILPSDGGIEETLQLSVDSSNEKDALWLNTNTMDVTGQNPEEENGSVLHTDKPAENYSPRDDSAHAPEEPETETSDKRCITSTYSLDMEPVNDPVTETYKRNVAVLQADSLTFPSEQKVELQEDVLKETKETILNSSNQTEQSPFSPTCSMQSWEQEAEAVDGVIHQCKTWSSTDMKTDSFVEATPPALPVDAQRAPLEQTAISINEEQSYMVSSAEMSEDAKDFSCFMEETHPTDSEESSSDEKISAEADCLSSETAEEVTVCITDSVTDVDPYLKDHVGDRTAPGEESDEVQKDSVGNTSRIPDVPQDAELPCSASPDEDKSTLEDEALLIKPESQIYTSEENTAEELQSLSDVSRDSEQEPELEAVFLSEETPSPLNEFSDSNLTEESLSAEDSFDAQLSKITHLSLIINDGAAGFEFPEEQPEE